MTNADKIRGMSDEQLADWIMRYVDRVCSTCVDCRRLGVNRNYSESCQDKLLEWLGQEHKERGEDED